MGGQSEAFFPEPREKSHGLVDEARLQSCDGPEMGRNINLFDINLLAHTLSDLWEIHMQELQAGRWT